MPAGAGRGLGMKDPGVKQLGHLEFKCDRDETWLGPHDSESEGSVGL